MNFSDVFVGQPVPVLAASFSLGLLLIEDVELVALAADPESQTEDNLQLQLIQADFQAEKEIAIDEYVVAVFGPRPFQNAWRRVREALGEAVRQSRIQPVDAARVLVNGLRSVEPFDELSFLWGLLSEWEDDFVRRAEYAHDIGSFLMGRKLPVQLNRRAAAVTSRRDWRTWDMPWTVEEAIAFAEHHIAVWNKHDLDEIIELYTENVELTSPFAEQVVGTCVVRGRDGLRGYFGAALAANAELQFEIVDVLRGLDSITIYMRSVGGRLVAEVLFVDADGLIEKVFAHYSCSPS